MFNLLAQRGAAAFYLAIFLNAAIDLGHKITIQNVIFKVHDGAEQVVLTAIINSLIVLPYVLFFVPVGKVANRFAKPLLMRATAWCTVVMLCLLWWFYRSGAFWPAFAITFLMAVQSAFYSPAKLGYLKVLFGEERLAAANGLAQSCAIIGILAGTLLFSLGFEALYSQAQDSGAGLGSRGGVLSQMPLLQYALMLLAAIQLWAVYRVPLLDERKTVGDAGGAGEKLVTARAILAQRRFLLPILGLALFWTTGQAMLAVFPAYAKEVASITNTAVIQGILTCTGLGIIAGAWLVGKLQHSPYQLGLAQGGIFLMIGGLVAVLFLRSAAGFALLYFLLGIASGLLIVPLNTFMQAHCEQRFIGSLIATSNLFQNIAMLSIIGLTIAMALLGLSPLRLLVALALGAGIAGLAMLAPLRALSGTLPPATQFAAPPR